MFQSQSQNHWMKNSKNLAERIEENQKFSFRQELYLFLNTTICHCYRHLAQTDRSLIERVMWAIIHLIGASALISFTTTSYESAVQNPLITTLHDTIYPVKYIPFPAVTICNNNRISRKAALDYAKELSKQDTEEPPRSVDYFLEQIIYLGRIYDFETENEHLVVAFQQFIDAVESNKPSNKTEKSDEQDFTDIIDRLTPKCEDLMLKCFFKSKEFKCMKDFEMMEQRRTAYGFCCSFNYMKRNDENPMNTPYFSDVTGPDMGLILVVNNTSNDYFYNMVNSIGFSIQVHSFDEFPDPSSGSSVEKFVGPQQEIFVRVDATSTTSERDILSYKSEKRQCLFAHENPQLGKKYTRSECFLNCKIRSVRALCDCLPFNYPPPASTTIQPKICTLQHIACLNKYKIKWQTIMSEIISVEGLEREMEESLLCRECYPSCSNNKYRLTTSYLPLVVNKRAGFGITNEIDPEEIKEVSVIRVYFGNRETWQYKQDVSFYWYEIFSNIGGLCGVVGGFSLIALTETCYFIIRQTVLYIMRKLHVRRRTGEMIIYP